MGATKNKQMRTGNLREICTLWKNHKPDRVSWILEALQIGFNHWAVYLPFPVQHKKLKNPEGPAKDGGIAH